MRKVSGPAAVVLVAMMLLPAFDALAASNWTEQGVDFSGKMVSSKTNSGGLELWTNDTLPTTWEQVQYERPPATSYFRAVYNERFGAHVFITGTGDANGTWTFNSATQSWHRMTPDQSPSLTSYLSQAMYDKRRAEVILIKQEMSALQCWVYNFSADNWTALQTANGPQWGGEFAAAYDWVSDRVLFFGGNYENETWSLDRQTLNWTRFYPAVSPPNYYHGITMVCDERTSEFVLYLGQINQLWSYNSTANSWADWGGGPQGNDEITAAYDASRGRMLLYPYQDGRFNIVDIGARCWTAVWTSNPWNALNKAVVYDTLIDAPVMHFGYGRPAILCETTSTWNLTSPENVPVPRNRLAAACDDVRGEMVIFGGNNSFRPLNDTFAFNLSTRKWRNLKSPDAPAPREYHSMVYHRQAGVFVMFGGAGMGDTWVYDLGTNRWTRKHPTVSPPPRDCGAMAYDISTGLIVLMGGGTYLNDTWTYDLNTDEWTFVGIAPVPARRGHQLASLEDGLLLMGGINDTKFHRETCIYNVSANTWELIISQSEPQVRYLHAMNFDRASGRVVMFSGLYGPDLVKDTWTFNPFTEQWIRRDVTKSPSARSSHALASSPLGVNIVFGGDISGGRLDETWLYDLRGYSAGSYLSEVRDFTDNVHYGRLLWNATIPPNTGCRIQIRTASTPEMFNAQAFYGENGTTSSYYNTSGMPVRVGPSGGRFFQYKVNLYTLDKTVTPVLKFVNVEYNTMHHLGILSPVQGETVTGWKNINWTLSDIDGDSFTYDIYLLDILGRSTTLAANLTPGSNNWPWNSANHPNGEGFCIRIVARDNDPVLPLSAECTSGKFSLLNNHPPGVNLTTPADGAEVTSSLVWLNWSWADSDFDPLIFSVFLSRDQFSNLSLPGPVATTTGSSYLARNLTIGSVYYWTVVASDGMLNSTVPGVRSFTVGNNAPVLTLLSPASGSTLGVTNVTLRWSGFDADGELLGYNIQVFDGPYSTTPLREAAVNATSYDLRDLRSGFTYFWTVIASDGRMNGTSPGRWNFSIAVNNPPKITSTPPGIAAVLRQYEYTVQASDADGDSIIFALVGAPAGMTIDNNYGKLMWKPGTSFFGPVSVIVIVSDGRGGVAEQRFSINVTLLRSTVLLISPMTNTTVTGHVKVQGEYTSGSLPVTEVFVRFDSREWKKGSITNGHWMADVDAAQMTDGPHRLEVRTFDGTLYSDTVSIDVRVVSFGTTTQSPVLLIAGTAIAMVAVLSIVLLLRRKRPKS